jgi:hypothetical protein
MWRQLDSWDYVWVLPFLVSFCLGSGWCMGDRVGLRMAPGPLFLGASPQNSPDGNTADYEDEWQAKAKSYAQPYSAC